MMLFFFSWSIYDTASSIRLFSFSERLFTQREKDLGHRIKCYYSRIAYLDAAEKRELAQLVRDTGLMTLNEIRELYGMSPIEGGDKRLQSLNYVNVELVDKYQLQDRKFSGSDESESD